MVLEITKSEHPFAAVIMDPVRESGLKLTAQYNDKSQMRSKYEP